MSSDKRRQLRVQGSSAANFGQQSENKRKVKSGGRSKQTKTKNGSAEDCKERTHDAETDKADLREQEPSHVMPENMKVTYVENSNYVVPLKEPPKPAVEIKKNGTEVLSKTENGESRIVYYTDFLDTKEAFILFDELNERTEWRQMNVVIRGTEYPQPRLVAWFGPFSYGYSGVSLDPQEMPPYISEIKTKIENFLAKDDIHIEFNSVLMNLYEHGKHSVAWHSDDELSMGVHPTIASVSLGASRKFEMRRKPTANNYEPPTEYFANLKHGSLLVMDGVMQMDWQHRVPKEAGTDIGPRINLTFRKVHKVERPNKMTK